MIRTNVWPLVPLQPALDKAAQDPYVRDNQLGSCHVYFMAMKPSTELFDLIRSLTKSEKRFFKLHSTLQSGTKNYMRIFDAIDRQHVYDEDALRRQFEGENFVKHLPSEKNHLCKLVLKSLRAFHAEATVSGTLKIASKNIEILFAKALYEEASRTLQRAKRVAKENEKFYYWYELLNQEKQLLEEDYASGRFSRDLEDLVAEEREVLAKLGNLAEYHVLYSRINFVFRSGGHARTDEERAMVEAISEHPLIKGKNTALSHRAATICYYTQGFCQWAAGDTERSLEKFLRVKKILDDHPHLRADLPKRYVRALEYIIRCRVELGAFKEARDTIRLMRQSAIQDGFRGIDIAVQVFHASYLGELRMLDRMGEHMKAVALTTDILHGIEEHGARLHKEQLLEFWSGLAIAHFGAGQVNKALFWLNKVLNDPEPQLRQDLFIHARLFNLLVHLELGNHDLLEYILRSTKRFLNKKHRAYEVERLLMEEIRKMTRDKRGGAAREHAVALRDGLAKLVKDPNAATVLKYFDYLAWAESRVRGVPFSDVVREKARPSTA